MALLTLFLMLTAAFFMGTYMYENLAHKYEYNKTKVSPETVPQGGTVVITGPKLDGSDVEVKLGDKLLKSDSKVESGDIKVTILKDPSIPPGAEVVINVKRRGLGFLSWPPIFPALPVRVKIGEPVKTRGALTLQVKSTVMLGDTLIIKNNGSEPFGKGGTVEFGTDKLDAVWKGSTIEAQIPNDPSFARADTLYVTRADNMAKGEHALTVKDPNEATTATTGTDGTATATDDTTATTGSASGGDSTAGPGGTTGAETTGSTGTTTGGGAAAFQPNESYDSMLAAVQQGDKDVLMKMALDAEAANDPYGRIYKVYAGAVLGRRSVYSGPRAELAKNPPDDSDPVGQILWKMAEAEAFAADRDTQRADNDYKSLSFDLSRLKKRQNIDLALVQAAIDRHKKGW